MALSDGLHLYNTLTCRKEPFRPGSGKTVTMYVCGPTVYDVCHMGHARSYVVFDVIARYLRWLGLEVRIAVNFTDVEERITERAEKLGADPLVFADEKISEYLEVMGSLGIQRANDYPRVSQFVPQMIEVVKRLVELGYAYRLGDRIFMDVDKAGGYGGLLHSAPEEALVGESGSKGIEGGRKNPFDFELWDGTVGKDPVWDSPWGSGRIGWHVECYVMSKILGHPIDIKGGGLDLVFPHHESTKLLASALGEELARFYVHNAFMTFQERKMSKSEGIFVSVTEALEKHSAESLRYFILSDHYRTTQPYSDLAVEDAGRAAYAVRKMAESLKRSAAENRQGPDDDELIKLVDVLREEFVASMNDDIDTPSVLGSIDVFLRRCRELDFGSTAAQKAVELFADIGFVLGFAW